MPSAAVIPRAGEEKPQPQTSPATKSKKPIGIIGVAKTKKELHSMVMTSPFVFIKTLSLTMLGGMVQAILLSVTVQYILCGNNTSITALSPQAGASNHSTAAVADSVSGVTTNIAHQESSSLLNTGYIPAMLKLIEDLAGNIMTEELASSLFQLSNKNILWIVLHLTHAFGYFAINWFFYGFLCYFLGWCEQYRVERAPRAVPSKTLVMKTLAKDIGSIFLIQPITTYLFANYAVDVSSTVCGQPLDVSRIALLTVAAMFLNETFFYLVHRLAHEVPFLYKHIHKQHHEYIGTICIAAEYAHPLEDLFANQLPTLAVFMVFSDIPVAFASAWMLLRLHETYEAHCGYCFIGSIAAKLRLCSPFHQAQHDFHHVVNKGNYGTSLFWDYALGTDALYTSKMLEGKF